MSFAERQRRLKWAEAILEALLEGNEGCVKIWEFSNRLKDFFGCTKELAADYASTIMKREAYEYDDFDIYLKGRKQKVKL